MLTTVVPASVNTAPIAAADCRRDRDEEPEARAALAEVHHEVAGLLGGPGPVWMRGHAQDVRVAITDGMVERTRRHAAMPLLRCCRRTLPRHTTSAFNAGA
jgi:hypothetical protein